MAACGKGDGQRDADVDRGNQGTRSPLIQARTSAGAKGAILRSSRRMAEPPYPWIKQELRAGRVIPFLGAGASFGSRNPSRTPWRELVAGNWKVSFLPAAFEVAEELSKVSNFPDPDSRELTKIAQYFSVAIGDPQLRMRLFEIFEFPQAPS